jgi:hypothetical protein
VLNKAGTRELAYVVKIDNILPLPGYDRVESAVVGGWKVVVRKGQFKPNDYAIYFEIDSKVPEKEPFMFLEPKHFKIKTQKMCKSISQGLLMSFDDFEVNGEAPAWLVSLKARAAAGKNIEHEFLTEVLGVTYAVAEDNKRKANPLDKYKLMSLRHSKLFSKPMFRWLMRRKWGKKLLFIFFGKKKNQRADWPYWVSRTDEERCLPGATKILTEQGQIQINKIVNQKLPVKVASIDKFGNIVYKKIIDYQKFDNSKKMITIKYPYKGDTTKTNALCCTEDHKIYTNRGYVEAKDLTLEDKVYMPLNCYGEDALSAIYGMLLGDSHIYDDKRINGLLRIVATNGEKQMEYLQYKQAIFNGDGKICNAGIGSFGTVPSYHYFLNVDPYISQQVRKDWFSTGKKVVSNLITNHITPVSLAFWYMDDGCLSYHESGSAWIRLNTQGFSYEENQVLVNILKDKFNIQAKINEDKIAKDGHQMYRIDLSVEMTKKFLEIVTPYMCHSMKYKTLDCYEDQIQTKTLSFEKKDRVIPIDIISIEEGQTKNCSWAKNFKIVYDLEVEDTHNFIADNIVVHNCQNIPDIVKDKSEWVATEKIDGSSTSATYKKKKFGKHEYYICSRNVVFDRPDKKCFYDTNIYVEMSEKYHFEKVLADIVNKYNLEWVTIQGESYGNKIQRRDYSIKDHDFAAFNLVFSDRGRLNSVEGKTILAEYGIPWVPILDEHFILPDTIDELLEIANGKSALDGGMREGLVFRSQDGVRSFKAVSNKFLLTFHQ